MKDGILHVEVWAEQSLEERSVKAAAISRRNQFSFTTPVSFHVLLRGFPCAILLHVETAYTSAIVHQDVGAVRRAYTEANMEAEIQGQKLTEVITKLKGDLKTVAEVNASHGHMATGAKLGLPAAPALAPIWAV